MRRKLLTTALIASGAAFLIAAGPKADLNQDGQVTKAEFTQTALDKFATADTNSDNMLDKAERKALREARRDQRDAKRFERLDANGDGALTPDEIAAKRDERDAKRDARRAEMLKKYDTNLDGELSEAERTVLKAERQEKRAAKKAERAEGGKKRRGDRPKADANEDGMISLDEHLAMSDQLFARMDANGDGVLTEGEGRKRKGRKGRKGKRG